MFTNFFKVDGNGEGDKMPHKSTSGTINYYQNIRKVIMNRIELNRETPDFFFILL